MKTYLFSTLLTLTLFIAGCGQNGPLYLPKTTPEKTPNSHPTNG